MRVYIVSIIGRYTHMHTWFMQVFIANIVFELDCPVDIFISLKKVDKLISVYDAILKRHLLFAFMRQTIKQLKLFSNAAFKAFFWICIPFVIKLESQDNNQQN